jgi:hypothetical protein
MYTRPFNSASNKTRTAANAALERKKKTQNVGLLDSVQPQCKAAINLIIIFE